MSNSDKGKALFQAAKALEETWLEIDRLTELFDKQAEKFSKDKKEPSHIKKDGVRDCDLPANTVWIYSYDYEFYRRKKKNPDAWISIEVRLCWDSENQIKNDLGEDFGRPLLIVKVSTIGEWDMLEPNLSDADDHYRALGKLLWWKGEDGICWIFAVPLLEIDSEETLVREIVRPLKDLLSDKELIDPEKLQAIAFANTRHVLSWKNDETDGTARVVETC